VTREERTAPRTRWLVACAVAASTVAAAVIVILVTIGDGDDTMPAGDGANETSQPTAPLHEPAAPSVSRSTSVPYAPPTATVFVSGTLRAEPTGAALANRVFQVEVRRGDIVASRPCTTDGAGEFRVAGFVPGVHDLTFSCRGFLAHTETIDVAKDRAVTGLDVVLTPGVRVHGVVHDLDERPARAAVVVWRREGEDSPAQEVALDADGRYVVTLAEPGRYEVCALPSPLRVLWNDTSTWQRLTVREDGANRFDLAFDLGRSLRVVVVDGGRAVEGVQVRCTATTPSRGATVHLQPTDARGRTQIDGLPAIGTLVLQVRHEESVDRREVLLEELPTELRLRL